MTSKGTPATASTTVRRSRRRDAVHEVMRGSDQFLSAQDVHHELRRRGEGVGLSTVYRNLQALAVDGEVDSLRNEDGEVLYRRCEARRHHHHLVCRACNSVVEIEGPTVERWTDRAAREHGYVDVEHTLEIFGVCPRCRAR